MKPGETIRFAKSTTAVLANFGTIATEPLLNLWFETAKEDDLTIEQWEAAAKKIIRGRKYTSQPTYADFLENVMGDKATEADVAEAQVCIVMKQIREIGYYRTPVFDDSITRHLMSSRWSWSAVCAMTETELKWWGKEFLEAYQSQKRFDRCEMAAIECGDERRDLKLLMLGIGK